MIIEIYCFKMEVHKGQAGPQYTSYFDNGFGEFCITTDTIDWNVGDTLSIEIKKKEGEGDEKE